jgi:adenylate cyclase
VISLSTPGTTVGNLADAMTERRQADPSPPRPPGVRGVDDALWREIVELHRWAVDQGLRGAAVDALFAGFCERLLAAGVPLVRAFVGIPTLHPQWAGRGYTWLRGELEVGRSERGEAFEQLRLASPFGPLTAQVMAAGGRGASARLRRRLAGPEAQLDYPVLHEFAAGGATDYYAQLVGFVVDGDDSRGAGIAYSFATDRGDGFHDHNLQLIEAALPALSLAIMSDAASTIAAGLLAAYLGEDAGRRVHQGAVERGSVRSITAVLWYADIRGFTAIADEQPGLAVVELLDEVLETIAAPLRPRGGQVLKFLGDGMLAIFPLADAAPEEVCRRALDAAAEAMAALDRLNTARRATGKPAAEIDLALHLGDVLYGNVGAVDRLDFTVIGPAVNEVSRIEALCEPLGRRVLLSAAVAAAAGAWDNLEPLGRHALRGVREPRDIYALRLAA